MENDFRNIFAAPIIADEKLRDHRRERINLEPASNVAQLIHTLIRLFK